MSEMLASLAISVKADIGTYIWIAVIVLSLLSEALSTSLVAIWFMPSALVALVLSLFGVEFWICALVFFVLSVLLVIFLKPIARRYFGANRVKTNVDAMVGAEGIVTEKIDNFNSCGKIRSGGQIWTARSETDGITFEEGARVMVVRIEGVKAICRAFESVK